MATIGVDGLLRVFPELATVGPASTGEIAVGGLPAPGDVVAFEDYKGDAEILRLVAGTDFVDGPDVGTVAASLADALAASGLFTVTRNGVEIFLTTTATGRASQYIAAVDAPLVFAPPDNVLEGGDALLSLAVTTAIAALPAGPWGALHLTGLELYAAHIAAFLGGASASGGGSGGAGAVQSQTIDKISVSYASINTGAIEAALASTRYGIQFAQLRDNLFAPKLGIVGRATMQRLGR